MWSVVYSTLPVVSPVRSHQISFLSNVADTVERVTGNKRDCSNIPESETLISDFGETLTYPPF